MHHASLLELIRQHVRQSFSRLGASRSEDVCETILIRDGFYCGRRFAVGSYRAVWFLEEHVVKFYGEKGEFISMISTDELMPASASAA